MGSSPNRFIGTYSPETMYEEFVKCMNEQELKVVFDSYKIDENDFKFKYELLSAVFNTGEVFYAMKRKPTMKEEYQSLVYMLRGLDR